MRWIITIIITAFWAWLFSLLFTWWMVAVIPFVVALIAKQKAGRAFLSGFISIALLWSILILEQDISNDYLLSSRMAQLFSLPHAAFIIVNIVVGALAGGLGGWSGAAMRGIFK